MKKLKEAYESAPAWAFGPCGPCIFRFSSVWVRDRVRFGHVVLDCFPSLWTIKMYPMTFIKERTSSHFATTPWRTAAPNSRVSSKWVPCCPDCPSWSGRHCSCFYLGITRAEAFLMASNVSYPDVSQHVLVDSLCAYLFIICEHHDISVRSCSNLMLILVM